MCASVRVAQLSDEVNKEWYISVLFMTADDDDKEEDGAYTSPVERTLTGTPITSRTR